MPSSPALPPTVPVALLVLDEEGRVLRWNPGATALFGFSVEEARGRRWSALVSPPEGQEEGARWVRQALEAGEATGRARHRRQDGDTVETDVVMMAVPSDAGAPVRIAVQERPVTRASSVNPQLAGVARLRGLLEAAPDAMVVVDVNGLLILANGQAEALFGYLPDEMIGQPIEILVPHRFRAHHPAQRSGYFGDPKLRPMGAGLDLHALRKDGVEFPAEISLSPLHVADGLLVTAAVRDISERKRQEELRRSQLEEASRLKSVFLANMSHELRTPLNAIIGFASLMYHGQVGPLSEDHREYLLDILHSGHHLLQLINDVLDLSKVESGYMVFDPEPVHLSRLIGEVRDTVRALAATRRISLHVAIDPRCEGITLDPARLKQVLFNYVSNALKFTGEGGAVAIRALPTGGRLLIEVEDNGIGIREEDIKLLFAEFRQLDASAAKKFQGTGLGLALTRRLVEAQGGQVGVRSTLGVGSVFYAVLPWNATVSPSPDIANDEKED